MTARGLYRTVFGAPRSLQRNIVIYMLLAAVFSVALVVVLSWAILREHVIEYRYEALEAQAREMAHELALEPDWNAVLRDRRLNLSGEDRVVDYALFTAQGQPLSGPQAPLPPRRSIYGASADSYWFVTARGRPGAAVPATVVGRKILVAAREGATHPYSNPGPLWREILGHSYPLMALVLIAALTAAVLAARRSLRPLRRVLEQLSRIDPSATGQRVFPKGAPREITPLIYAINRMVSRMENGYQAQRAFAGNVAHELRTPISVLKSRLQTSGGALPRAELLTDIEQLERITYQLLDMSRVEMLAETGFEPVDLAQIAADLAREMAPTALDRGVPLAVTGENHAPALGNPGFLRMALRNLVENAVLHAPPGSEVEIIVQSQPAGWQVRDHGSGVAGPLRTRIFRRFDRGDNTSSERPGAGVGLSIVMQVATAHGGKVRVEDAPGGGALFTMTLGEPGA